MQATFWQDTYTVPGKTETFRGSTEKNEELYMFDKIN